MFTVVVEIKVKPEYINQFAEASKINAACSLNESGIVVFDVLQQIEDPSCFVLYEVYYSPEDQLAHRETEHYKKWRDEVSEWMAKPRVGTRYAKINP